jgi:hypothetical protein
MAVSAAFAVAAMAVLAFDLAEAGMSSGVLVRGPDPLRMAFALGAIVAWGALALGARMASADNRQVLAEATGVWLTDTDVLRMWMRGSLR